MSHTPQPLSSLSAIQTRFTHVLLDIYGVLHAGGPAFPHAIQCLEALKAAGKKVYLFSNAPRLSHKIQETLALQGIQPSLYETIFSSGQEVRHCFETQKTPYKALGQHYFHIGVPVHAVLEGLPFKAITALDQADFVLLTGPNDPNDQAEDYESLLQEMKAKNLTAVCANSDPYVIIQGQTLICGGSLAAMYAQMGGTVLWHGKPHLPFYAWALAQIDAPKEHILAIGDSMWTDIKGAAAAGLQSALITTTGVHQELFNDDADKALQTLLKTFKDAPTYVLPRLA